MDKQLLTALNKTSDAIEALAQALESSQKATSATANTLKSGNFGAQLQDINKSLKSIKADTQEIIKQNKTIIAMSKKQDKVGGGSEGGLPTDNKKLDGLKKGIAVVLLLAVAVLAIGMAFKLVGKIDFLSVVALGIGIVLISIAFEKVAKLNLSIKQAFTTSVVMVMIAAAVTASSWILKMITPIGFSQAITAILISAMFVVISMRMREILLAAVLFGRLRISPVTLLMTMVAISAAITASSYILRLITTISFSQALTAIMISLMFAIISYNFERIAIGVLIFSKFKIKKTELIKTLVGIAAAITASSWILKLLLPLSFSQLVTAIFISAMFFLISFNLEKIAMGVIAFKKTKVSAASLIMVLVGVAAAITASSYILKAIVPISFTQFVVALGISLLFALLSFVMPDLVTGIVVVEKLLGKGKIFMIPLVLVTLAAAIVGAAFLFNTMPDVPWMIILKALALGVVMAVLAIVMTPAIFLLAWLGVARVTKAALAIVILAGAIAAASLLISKGNYEKYPGWKWSLFVGLSIAIFGVVGWVLTKIGGLKDYVVGGIIIVIMAGVIWLTSKILNKGSYQKYPTFKWVLATAAALAAFGILAVMFGIIAMSGVGAVALLAGAVVIIGLAGVIYATSKILNKGSYDKYPRVSWLAGVAAAIVGFSIMAALLGIQFLNPFFWAGFGVILSIANLITDVSKVLGKGKYDVKGFASWAASVTLLYTVFTPLILILGAVAALSAVIGFFTGSNPFDMAKTAFISIAETIVKVSEVLRKGTYTGGPTESWAKGISIALGAFMPVYRMLMDNAIMSFFGMGGVGPDDFSKAILTVCKGITTAAWIFKTAQVAFEGGPPEAWARGVGKAIGAFAPVYKVLQEGKGWFSNSGPEDVQAMKQAIITISEGIVEAAYFFAKNTAPFQEGKYPSAKWGRGVGKSIAAFAPVFEAISNTSWLSSNDETIRALGKGIRVITESIIESGRTFASVDSKVWSEKSVPTAKWARGVSKAIGAFSEVFTIMVEQGSGWIGPDMEEVAGQLAYGIRIISRSIADAGGILSSAGESSFKVYPSESWGKGVRTGVNSFLKIFSDLESKGFSPAGFSMYSKMLEGGIRSMANVAKILSQNSKYFKVKLDPNFVKNISKNVIEFAKLGLQLDKMLVTTMSVTTKSGGLMGIGGTTKTEQVRVTKDMGIVDKVAQAMSSTAYILWKNAKYFGIRINPNFMKSISRNVMDYVGLALYLMEKQTELDSLGSFGENSPIDKVAKGMVVLAGAYDKLAAALMRYAKAQSLVLSVAKDSAKFKSARNEGISRTQSEGGPESIRRTESDRPSLPAMTGMNLKAAGRRKQEWEVDLKQILKNLKLMTSEDPQAPGLMRELIMKTQESNVQLTGILDELDSHNRREKKKENTTK